MLKTKRRSVRAERQQSFFLLLVNESVSDVIHRGRGLLENLFLWVLHVDRRCKNVLYKNCYFPETQTWWMMFRCTSLFFTVWFIKPASEQQHGPAVKRSTWVMIDIMMIKMSVFFLRFLSNWEFEADLKQCRVTSPLQQHWVSKTKLQFLCVLRCTGSTTLNLGPGLNQPTVVEISQFWLTLTSNEKWTPPRLLTVKSWD